jgi:small neutral amino acid transporter SnatA (MarC family)
VSLAHEFLNFAGFAFFAFYRYSECILSRMGKAGTQTISKISAFILPAAG